MPEIFPLLYPEKTGDSTLWPPTQWAAIDGSAVPAAPDVVVIGLGGNDLSLSTADGGQRSPIPIGNPSDPADAGASLVAGFIGFVDQLAGDFRIREAGARGTPPSRSTPSRGQRWPPSSSRS